MRLRRWKILANLLRNRPHAVGAEIGVQGGRTTHYLLENLPGIEKYYCIDPWETYEGFRTDRMYSRLSSRSYKQFCKVVLSAFEDRIVVHKMKSWDAAPLVPDGSLDFVFIDGSHVYEHVLRDIRDWTQKVRDRGLISGHDFTTEPPDWWNGGVARAVREVFGDAFELEHCSIWWVRKGDGE